MTPVLLALAVQAAASTPVPADAPAIVVPRIVIPRIVIPPATSAPSAPTSAPLRSQPSAPVVGPIGRQALPAAGCAAYLWTQSEPHQLVAMADAGLLRLTIDARPAELPRTGAAGTVAHGLAASTSYAAGELVATLDLTVADREGLTSGATVPDAVLRVERVGRDAVAIPLAGLVGCR